MHFKIENLKFKYDKQIVFDKQNFTINRGQKILIHGPSGCGKTTLINLMSGLLKSQFGKIIFENEDLFELSENQLDKLRAKNFGFVFQRLYLINYLNVEQNIQLANISSNSCDMNALIEELGLLDKRKSKIINKKVPVFNFDGEKVWGATAMILAEARDLILFLLSR